MADRSDGNGPDTPMSPNEEPFSDEVPPEDGPTSPLDEGDAVSVKDTPMSPHNDTGPDGSLIKAEWASVASDETIALSDDGEDQIYPRGHGHLMRRVYRSGVRRWRWR